jgi:hypothetical protein
MGGVKNILHRAKIGTAHQKPVTPVHPPSSGDAGSSFVVPIPSCPLPANVYPVFMSPTVIAAHESLAFSV